MKKNYGVVIWGLIFVCTIFLTLIIPDSYSQEIWTAIVFDIMAFVCQLLVWSKKRKNAKDTFYGYPAFVASSTYLVLQFLLSIIIAISQGNVSFKIEIIIEFVLMILMWVIIICMGMASEKVESLDSRQKDHHKEL